MPKRLRFFFVLTVVVALVRCGKGNDEVLWRAAIVPCSIQTCGGISQNVATMGLSEGEVVIRGDGTVGVRIEDLKTSNGSTASNKSLDVYFGAFAAGQYEGEQIGTVTTDGDGDYDGTIRTSGGSAFTFGAGTTRSGQFIFNDRAVRSEFITGFAVQ